MRVTLPVPNWGANAQAVPQQCTFKSDYNVYISSASGTTMHIEPTFHRLQHGSVRAKSQLRGGGEVRLDPAHALLPMKISPPPALYVFWPSFIQSCQSHIVW